ncbi:MAG: STAS domain-containing protein [Heyndrickxia sp.]
MHRNKDLHSFLLTKATTLTEEWYNSLDKSDPSGVYSSENPDVINDLKKQNYEFHLHLCEVFVKEETIFLEDFQKWIQTIAQDQHHLNTPIQFIIREFFRVRELYLTFIKEFVAIHEGEFTNEMIDRWNGIIIKAFDKVILSFVEEHQYYGEQRLIAQQELIQELSCPVIALYNNMAMLPLIGEVDTRRAKFMIDNTLKQCAKIGVELLVIDLSGVVMIDTMVAQQIFSLITALRLIGVKTILSGIRPEIAQTAVQLGLDFQNIETYSTLNQALSSITLTRE